jgi:glycosyltransferase involved in cell wall biosynthesis
MKQSKPYISVVIPAYNEEALISGCLYSIAQQDYPHDLYEIILVDNSSTDKTSEIVSRDFPRVRLVDEPRQGVVFARIRGIAEARGEIIVCTDADSTVPVHWLSKFAAAYADPKVVAVAGTVKHPEKSLLSYVLRTGLWINYWIFHIMMGCNMSFRTQAYLASGGFDERMGFGEDAYITQQLKKRGKVVILHRNVVTTSLRRFYSNNWLAYSIMANLVSFSLFVLHRPLKVRLTPASNTISQKDPAPDKSQTNSGML